MKVELQLSMMKVMVWCFVSDTHRVMTTLFLVMFVLVLLDLTEQLPSKHCGVFSELQSYGSTEFHLVLIMIWFISCLSWGVYRIFLVKEFSCKYLRTMKPFSLNNKVCAHILPLCSIPHH
jgi:hypothetical protein